MREIENTSDNYSSQSNQHIKDILNVTDDNEVNTVLSVLNEESISSLHLENDTEKNETCDETKLSTDEMDKFITDLLQDDKYEVTEKKSDGEELLGEMFQNELTENEMNGFLDNLVELPSLFPELDDVKQNSTDNTQVDFQKSVEENSSSFEDMDKFWLNHVQENSSSFEDMDTFWLNHVNTIQKKRKIEVREKILDYNII